MEEIEDQIFGGEVGDDKIYDTNLRLTESHQTKHRQSHSNVQRNESLVKYILSIQILNRVRS
jgi:hypothetical protein